MKMEARKALDELVTGMRAGRLTRRSFLARAGQVGLSAGTALSLLESCANSTSSQPIKLVWQSEFDITMTYQDLVNKFNQAHSGEIHVTLRSIQSGTNDLTVLERNMFRANNASVDLFSLDTTVVAEFAHNKWITPISEQQWPKSERAKYLDQSMDTCTYQGQVWAAPYRTDVGLIYYRTDLVDAPPRTWAELASSAFKALAKKSSRDLRYGYVWQAAQYEGLVCDFIEILSGNGGAILDPNDEQHVVINSPAAADALAMMVGWVNTLSPADITTYTEEVARQVWESGQAVFMRNWPYVYADAKQSPLATKFGVLPMMHGSGSPIGHSAIGGWQIAINNNISPDHKEAAWTFIRYMMSSDAQLAGAQNASWAVTLKSVYDDPQLESHQPIFRLLREKNILSTAQARPKTPHYDQISQAIRTWVHQALLKENTVKDALTQLSNSLTSIVRQN